VRARRAFDAASGMATANGRPQREAIFHAHADALVDAHPSLTPTTEPS
jgi:long-chain acyl-CoA synthetase